MTLDDALHTACNALDIKPPRSRAYGRWPRTDTLERNGKGDAEVIIEPDRVSAVNWQSQLRKTVWLDGKTEDTYTPRSRKNAGHIWWTVWMTVAPVVAAYHGARTKAKRSPKGRSASSGGSISIASSGQPVRADASHGRAKAAARLRPARSRRQGDQPRQIAGAGRPMPSQQPSPSSETLEEREKRATVEL